MKKVRFDFQCYNCKKKYTIAELEELGYVELIDEYHIIDCPNCGNQTYLKNKGFKSCKLN